MLLRQLALSALALIPAVLPAQVFTEVSVEAGMEFQPVGASAMGGGVAWFDANGDGWEDAYVTGCTLADRLYLNNGDGTFEEVSESAGLGITADYNTTGVTTADVDRDGHTDVFITTWRKTTEFIFAPNLLFHNNGDGSFTEIAAEVGLLDSVFSMSATFADINRDGWIDLYIGNYVEAPAFVYDDNNLIIGFDHDCFHDSFYLNNGDGSFTDATDLYGTENPGCTLAVRNSDMDQDGDQDLLIANDFGEWIIPNKLFRNNYPEASFSEISVESGAAAQMYAMGVATGDYDHDGDLDHYLTNLGRNLLMQKQDDFFYTDQTTQAGIENEGDEDLLYTSWATGFADFDNDGWEDLFVVNGHVPAIPAVENHIFDPNKVYRNNGDGTFADVSEASGTDDTGMGRGGALCDFDRDGDLDFMAVNIFNAASPEPEALRLFRNEQQEGNWITLSLEGTLSNPDAIGSLVEIDTGDYVYLREISGGGDTHASQHSRMIHVGLGSLSEVLSITVHWPNGLVETLENPDINMHHVLVEGFATSITELINPAVRLYPNPASGSVFLSGLPFQECLWSVHRSDGVLTDQFRTAGPGFRLDLTGYAPGVYILRGAGPNSGLNVRLVVTD